jgi:hypothetical protein
MNAQLAAAAPPSANPPGRVWLALGFICASIFTAALTVGGNLVVNDRQATRAEKIERVTEFEKLTKPFRELISNYNTAILEKKDLKTPREALRKNIFEQDAALQVARLYLSGDARARAETYKSHLADLADALEDAKDPVKAIKFAQLALNVDTEAASVTTDLRKASGLDGDREETDQKN